MAFTPSNRVYLLDTPLDNTQKNQLRFSSRTAQQNYFKSCKVAEIDNIDYIKKDNAIIIEGQLDDYWRCNYVMYQNTDNNSRWYYAFITRMEWQSERTIAIYIETDVYQTWRMDCDLLQSFTVREHVDDDGIGKHLVNEGIDYGEYVMNSYEQSDTLGDLWFVMAVSDTVSDTESVIRGIYGNVYSGLAFFAYSPDDASALSAHISSYVDAGKGDAIQFIFTIPENILPVDTNSGDIIPNFSTTRTLNYNFSTFSTDSEEKAKFKELNGYTPINNKLYCYPYNVLYVSNNNGSSAEFHFEDFHSFEITDKISFRLEGNVGPNPTILLYPYDYRLPQAGISNNSYEYGLQLSGFPLCSWGNDTFNAWVAQNGLSTAITVGASTVAMVGSAFMGNVAGVVGGAVGIASQMSQLYKAGLQPDQARGNVNGGSLNIAGFRQDFFFARMSVRYEYAKRIDDFFTMFGYKVNELKIPNEHSRNCWNYIQTIDVNIKGAIPSDDMRKLKEIYNNGVTLWHEPMKFCNYNFSNDII